MQHETSDCAILAAGPNPVHASASDRDFAARSSLTSDDATTDSSVPQKVVLLVEDEFALREILGEYLRDHGLKVLEADSGVRALEIVRSDAHIDILVSDIGLPGGVDGRQVARGVMEQHPGVPVILITGYTLDPFVAGTELIRKPFDPEVLAERVKAKLEAVS